MKGVVILAGQASDFPVHWLSNLERRLIKYSQIASRFKTNSNDRIQHLNMKQTLDTVLYKTDNITSHCILYIN